MVKKTEDKQEVVEPTGDEVATPLVAETTKTYTQEELDTITAEYNSKIVKLENEKRGISKLQSEADRELQRLKSQPTQSSQTPILRTLIEEMEAHPTQDEYGNAKPSPRLAELKRQVAVAEQQERAERAKVYAQTKHQELVQQIVDAGLDPNSEDFYPVEDAWETGQYDIAKRRVERILAKQKPKEEKVETRGKTEEEIRAEAKAEAKAEIFAKYKIQDVSSPSGGSMNRDDIIAKYARGEATRSEYERAIGKKSE